MSPAQDGFFVRRIRRMMLAAGLATVALWVVLAQLDAQSAVAQGTASAWPLTADGASRFAGWSPDGDTVLINRWGEKVGPQLPREVLSELWAVGVLGGPAIRISENAVQPAYSPDGQQLAYLSFAVEGHWIAYRRNLANGRDTSLGTADWHTPPVWIGNALALVRDGQVSLAARNEELRFPRFPQRARVRLTADGDWAAWSDGASLWASARLAGTSRLLAGGARVTSFVWAPDGRRLAYVTVAETAEPELWVVSIDGDEPPRLLAQGQAELFSQPAWAPDGRTLAFSRTPLGAETSSASDIWLVSANGDELRPLPRMRNELEESSPSWSPDGRYLAFHRAGDVWVLDVTRPQAAAPDPTTGPATDTEGLDSAGRRAYHTTTPLVQQTPPATIRVIHRAENCYRWEVPVGQIDIITFENYVKQVLAVEISPATYPTEAIKAQATAVRTYGWYYTALHVNEDWDVSDWTDYQAMGREDQRHARSDAAADATEGQYIAYQGSVIKAFYCAENGSPTRNLEGRDYIQAVDDPVSFGQTRLGHGWGMSQRGARRWAEWHGWGYQQILAHYYTGITIELPSTGGPLPLSAITLPWSDYTITSNRVVIVANASDEESATSAVGFYALTDTHTLLVTDTVQEDGWSTVWNVTSLADTSTTAITLSVLVADQEGNVQSESQTVRIGLDRRPPTHTTAIIGDPYTETMTVTISSLSATDPSPGSGVHAVALSNDGWAWEGEDLHHESGEEVADPEALNARAWRGLAAVHAPGAWYGPYTDVLPPGNAYRAYFRLKTTDVLTTAEVAVLEVVDSAGTRLLGLRRLRGTDFRAANVYQEFPTDFIADTAGLEFRTAFRATADLYLDRVLVVGYPIDITDSVSWRLSPGEGIKTVTVKFVDRAGNVSADLITTVTLSDTTPPGGWQDFGWSRGREAITATVRVSDEVSGLDVDSARHRLSIDGGSSWGEWSVAACTGVSGTTELQTIAADNIALSPQLETAARIEFEIADMRGHASTMSYTVKSWALYLPLILRP